MHVGYPSACRSLPSIPSVDVGFPTHSPFCSPISHLPSLFSPYPKSLFLLCITKGLSEPYINPTSLFLPFLTLLVSLSHFLSYLCCFLSSVATTHKAFGLPVMWRNTSHCDLCMDWGAATGCGKIALSPPLTSVVRKNNGEGGVLPCTLWRTEIPTKLWERTTYYEFRRPPMVLVEVAVDPQVLPFAGLFQTASNNRYSLGEEKRGDLNLIYLSIV